MDISWFIAVYVVMVFTGVGAYFWVTAIDDWWEYTVRLLTRGSVKEYRERIENMPWWVAIVSGKGE